MSHNPLKIVLCSDFVLSYLRSFLLLSIRSLLNIFVETVIYPKPLVNGSVLRFPQTHLAALIITRNVSLKLNQHCR